MSTRRIDFLFINLKIVAQVQAGAKLDTSGELFKVHNPGWLTSFLRTFGVARRHTAARRLDEMVALVRAHLEDDPDCRELLLQHVQAASRGVRALQETYRDDVTVCASLERVFDKMAVLTDGSIKVDETQS